MTDRSGREKNGDRNGNVKDSVDLNGKLAVTLGLVDSSDDSDHHPGLSRTVRRRLPKRHGITNHCILVV